MLFEIQIAVYRLFGDKTASLRLRMGRGMQEVSVKSVRIWEVKIGSGEGM